MRQPIGVLASGPDSLSLSLSLTLTLRCEALARCLLDYTLAQRCSQRMPGRMPLGLSARRLRRRTCKCAKMTSTLLAILVAPSRVVQCDAVRCAVRHVQSARRRIECGVEERAWQRTAVCTIISRWVVGLGCWDALECEGGKDDS